MVFWIVRTFDGNHFVSSEKWRALEFINSCKFKLVNKSWFDDLEDYECIMEKKTNFWDGA